MDLFWENPSWHLTDKHLMQLNSSPFLRAMPKIDLKPHSLYIIRGPRQIGKTSFLKEILKNSDPTKAFFFSCDNIGDHKQLNELLLSIKNSRSIIILDEVTYVKEWARAVKYFMDSGYSGTLIVSGSNSVDLRRGGEQLPGRYGEGRDIVILPMNLHEFIDCRKKAGWPEISLKESAEIYFKTGGFPAAVIEGGAAGNSPLKFISTIWKWLVGDFLKFDKSERYTREILGQIAKSLTLGQSLQSIAQKTGLGSHHTAQSYIELLEDSFALRTCFQYDPKSDTFHFKKEKKFYFMDPVFYWVACFASGIKPSEDASALLAENTAHEFLFQKIVSTSHQIEIPRFGYTAGKDGEIDFILSDNSAIEVKWSEYAHNLSKRYLAHPENMRRCWTKNNFLE